VRIIARKTLITFVKSLQGNKNQAAVKTALDAWFAEASKETWANSAAVKQSYATASILSASRIVFNIKGNDYRLIVEISYAKSIIWIIWLGTHKDYDLIDATGVKYNG
jgi:mRNA interferase HigB